MCKTIFYLNTYKKCFPKPFKLQYVMFQNLGTNSYKKSQHCHVQLHARKHTRESRRCCSVGLRILSIDSWTTRSRVSKVPQIFNSGSVAASYDAFYVSFHWSIWPARPQGSVFIKLKLTTTDRVWRYPQHDVMLAFKESF